MSSSLLSESSLTTIIVLENAVATPRYRAGSPPNPSSMTKPTVSTAQATTCIVPTSAPILPELTSFFRSISRPTMNIRNARPSSDSSAIVSSLWTSPSTGGPISRPAPM